MTSRLHTDTLVNVKQLAIVALVCVAACSGKGPTAPTPPPIVNVPIAPPVVVAPPPVAPPVVVTPAPLPTNDPRFNLAFYRMFVHNALDGPVLSLRRQTEAPRIYLRMIDDAGAPIDAFTLNETARALENTAGSLTGVFGLAGIERGTDTRQNLPGWITVRWSQFANERDANYSYCGQAVVGGNLLTLYPKSRFCRCGGGPAVVLSIVKHELGHALGFHHTDSREDLMFPTFSACDQTPSEREKFHATVAYTRPIGTAAP